MGSRAGTRGMELGVLGRGDRFWAEGSVGGLGRGSGVAVAGEPGAARPRCDDRPRAPQLVEEEGRPEWPHSTGRAPVLIRNARPPRSSPRVNTKGLAPPPAGANTQAVPPALLCTFPHVSGSTGYARGCRCERCCTAVTEIKRRHQQKRAQARRAAKEARERGWYSGHRDALRIEAGGQPGRSDVELARRRDLAPPFVTGPYTAAEDRVIIAWRATDLMLAVALGRTYWSVVGRKHRLRRVGRLWT